MFWNFLEALAGLASILAVTGFIVSYYFKWRHHKRNRSIKPGICLFFMSFGQGRRQWRSGGNNALLGERTGGAAASSALDHGWQ